MAENSCQKAKLEAMEHLVGGKSDELVGRRDAPLLGIRGGCGADTVPQPPVAQRGVREVPRMDSSSMVYETLLQDIHAPV